MQSIHSILIFASLALTLGLTLLLGAQWGVVMGILAYLAGSNVLLNQEVKKLKAYIDRVIDELPELLRQMSSKAESQGNPPTDPAQPATATKPQAVDAIEQRMSALDHKLELLLQRMQTPVAAPQPQAQTASYSLPSVQPASSSPPLQAAPPTHQSMASAAAAAQPMPSPAAAKETMATAAAPAATESDLMREFLLKMAQTMLASKAEGASQVHPTPSPQAASPSAAASEKAPHPTPSLNELRSELDKIARELSLELNRKP